MKRLGVRLWLGEGPEYPQVIFDSVKDNDIAMTQLLEDCKEKNMWFLSWFVEYLSLIHDTAIYAQVVAKMANYVCEELQVERFGDARPFVMSLAAKVSIRLVRPCIHLPCFPASQVAEERGSSRRDHKCSGNTCRDFSVRGLLQFVRRCGMEGSPHRHTRFDYSRHGSGSLPYIHCCVKSRTSFS